MWLLLDAGTSEELPAPEGSLQRRNAGTRAGCQVPDPLHLLLMDAQQVPTLARIQCRLQHDALQRAATPARV